MSTFTHHAVIVGSVVLMHAAVLWALNQAAPEPAAEAIVPVRLVTVLHAAAPPAAPPAAKADPAPSRTPQPRRSTVSALPPQRAAAVTQPRTAQQAAPKPPTAAAPTLPMAGRAQPAQASSEASPEAAPTAVVAAGGAGNLPEAAPTAVHVSPPAAPSVVPPSSNAAHLNNPPPPYPPMSRRLGETGRVVVRVLIGPDGRAHEARIHRSSGFERLDQVALDTARDRWRYVPGTRGGVAEAMWFNVPIQFTLE